MISYNGGINAARKQSVVNVMRAAAHLLDLDAKQFLRLIKLLGIK